MLITANADALWVTSYPFAEYVKHEWAGAWVCSCFRNESHFLSSTLIREAVAITKSIYGEPPPLGMVTFVDPSKLKVGKCRGREYCHWPPGRSYLEAGFKVVGKTKGGLIALQLLPQDMPEPVIPIGSQLLLIGEAA